MQIGYISQEIQKEPFLMSRTQYIEAGRYAISKERLEIVSSIFEYGLFLFWIDGGLKALNYTLQIEDELTKSTLFVLGFIFVNSLIQLPIEVYRKFVIDERFGFNRSTLKLYIEDKFKELLLTIFIGTPIIGGIIYFISSFQLWWLWSFFAIFGVVVFLNMVYPTLIVPIFNKLSPLEDSELKKRIEELLAKTGFESQGVFSIDASKRDSRLNAYFGGFGKSKRVILFDTLIEKLQPIELIAVLGHELGHFKHGDIYKNIAMVGLLLFLVFYGIGHIPTELFSELGLPNSSYVLLSFALLFVSVISFFMLPIFGLISRYNEFQADKFGSELSGNSIYLQEALKKLVTENKSFPKAHPLYIFFYYTHPPISERLKALEKWRN